MPAILSRINVYPIKSLDGAMVAESAIVSPGALAGDREFVVVDRLGDPYTGKRTDQMHRIRARHDLPARRVTLSAGAGDASFNLDRERAQAAAWFSRVFDNEVRIEQKADGGFPDDVESPGPTLVSLATLETVAGWFDLSVDETRHRFRANLEIEGVEPFWEDRLYGPLGRNVPFRIGAVQFLGTNPCQRCPVPTRNPWTGAETRMFPKTFHERRGESLPEWACRERFDHFFRLATNTKIDPGSWKRVLRVGDEARID